MPNATKLPRWVPPALGIGQVLSVTFLLFPSAGTVSPVGGFYGTGLATEWLGVVAAGVFLALIMCVLAPVLERSKFAQSICHIVSLLAQLLAVALMLYGVSGIAAAVGVFLVSFGVTPVSILWSRWLMDEDAEVAERALLAAIALVAVNCVLFIVLPSVASLFGLGFLGSWRCSSTLPMRGEVRRRRICPSNRLI